MASLRQYYYLQVSGGFSVSRFFLSAGDEDFAGPNSPESPGFLTFHFVTSSVAGPCQLTSNVAGLCQLTSSVAGPCQLTSNVAGPCQLKFVTYLIYRLLY